ncbi:YicC family protein [Peribacillus muralis]|uniref:YicC/YloC family endoribonuclease n=1 Tax=Peribacillus muralis TaxID=264697 RepID=UPI001F4DB9BD|nr:YicC/YloC family endoribonuclease [Peribacillus muralis]MCK1992536.1 YicC family protein [Peribacillus muralis]MCK2013092.1 YicC family protein [Peribacillus muralis]
MVTSMTGYGREEAGNGQVKVFAEIKTVNHRFCEYTIRMPRQLLALEEKVKKKANQYIRRGRAEIFLTVEGESLVSKKVKIDYDLADQYVGLMAEVKDKYKLEGSITLQDVLQLESIFMTEEVPAVPNDLEALFLQAVSGALENLKTMRAHEGQELALDMINQLNRFGEIVATVKKHAPSVVEKYKARLEIKLAELTDGLIEESRIVTEAAIFADKCDINEELTRLESHIRQFSGTLNVNEPIGRKLDFLVQEMNREINTIGSKANDSAITKDVVEMKSLLEKLKEQVQNIE